MVVVEIDNLIKKYKKNIAIDNLSLCINEGEIFGLLGPSGAGKSTIINIISSLLKPTSGKVIVMGNVVDSINLDIKRYIGVVPQNIALYMEFTAAENVILFAKLYGLKNKELKKNVKEALEFVGLLEEANKKAKTFSNGMLRRLNIACSIVHKPKLLIIDEPTHKLDLVSKKNILEAIKVLNHKGMTIILASHDMNIIEEVCTKIAVIDQGKVLVEGTNKQLKNMISNKKVLSVMVDEVDKLDKDELESIEGINNVVIQDNNFIFNTEREVNNLDIIIKNITNSGAKILDLAFKEVTLETVFLALTGKMFAD